MNFQSEQKVTDHTGVSENGLPDFRAQLPFPMKNK